MNLISSGITSCAEWHFLPTFVFFIEENKIKKCFQIFLLYDPANFCMPTNNQIEKTFFEANF